MRTGHLRLRPTDSINSAYKDMFLVLCAPHAEQRISSRVLLAHASAVFVAAGTHSLSRFTVTATDSRNKSRFVTVPQVAGFITIDRGGFQIYATTPWGIRTATYSKGSLRLRDLNDPATESISRAKLPSALSSAIDSLARAPIGELLAEPEVLHLQDTGTGTTHSGAILRGLIGGVPLIVDFAAGPSRIVRIKMSSTDSDGNPIVIEFTMTLLKAG